MKTNQNPNFYIIGGLCGIIGTLSYIIVITLPFSPSITFLFAMLWPILTIIFAFSVYKYFAMYKQTITNQLAFLFTSIAFILVSIMLSIQLVVQTGLEESIINASGVEKDTLILISKSLRWVDLGVDLAWDMFLGVALILLSFVIRRHPKFGLWWSIPLAILALAVVILNLLTFPDPPGTKGVIDVGPLIGTFIIIFGGRMAYLGIKMGKTHRSN